jgi:hypothetical protein
MALDVGRLVKHLRSGIEPEVALDGGAGGLARREAEWFTAGEDWVSFSQGGAWLSYRATCPVERQGAERTGTVPEGGRPVLGGRFPAPIIRPEGAKIP